MSKSNVTVFLEVFNEETRIESCLKSFCWVDELIVFDKNSTDRTREIAEKYATEVVTVPFTQASENVIQNISSRTSCDWVLFPTASSLIHPNLVDEIIKLTTDNSFDYDVIGMPFGIYSFGIKSRNSPWTATRKFTLIKRSALKLSTKLHNEISYTSNKVYKMPFMESDEILYHCTHKDADDFFYRVIRYTKYEADHEKYIGRNQAIHRAFFEMLKSVFTVTCRRRTFLLGWDGVALSLAYICYFIMKFIYVWDSRRDNGNVTYRNLRNKIDNLWAEKKQQ
jgi:glycosyltransferase involved in cell wall biosynthesis